MSARGESAARRAVVETALAMSRMGLSPGKAGNVSRRFAGGFLVTPSGMAYDAIAPADIAVVDLDGDVIAARKKPSSETPFHAAIYRAREDAGAIVHTHSPRATALASAGRGIPAFHYMVAVAGGPDIPCAPYATFGSDALAGNAVAALAGRKATLLANHGVIALGATLAEALSIAAEVETLAGQYLDILAAGLTPVILGGKEMKRVLAKFESYGKA